MTMIAKLIRVRGKVQGVGYRESMREEAERLGITGWVRNRQDSSVEAFVQGDLNKVSALLEWADQGPVHAQVNTVTTEEAKPDASIKSFQRRDTH